MLDDKNASHMKLLENEVNLLNEELHYEQVKASDHQDDINHKKRNLLKIQKGHDQAMGEARGIQDEVARLVESLKASRHETHGTKHQINMAKQERAKVKHE